MTSALTVVGTVAIPFMAIGFVTMARMLRSRLPRTGLVAGALLAVGMWGFLGVHVLGLAEVALSEVDDRAGAAAALKAMESDPVVLALFLAPFLLGCVLGLVTLSVGLLRSGVGPRWIPVALLAFLVIDFGTGPVGPVDPHWLYLAAAIGFARVLGGTTGREWALAGSGSTSAG